MLKLFQKQKQARSKKRSENEPERISLKEEEQKGDAFLNAVGTIEDFISPNGIDFHESSLGRLMDNAGKARYFRPFFISRTGYPREMSTGWLNNLLSAGDVDVMVHISKVPRKQAIRDLQKAITMLKANLRQERKRGNIDMEAEYQRMLNDAEILRDEISIGVNDIFYVSTQMMLFAPDEEELENRSAWLEDLLAGNQFTLRVPYERIIDGFKSVFPTGQNFLKDTYRNLDRNALATFFPFASSEMRYTGGIPLGINVHTGNLVFYNPFAKHLHNYNLCIFGVSGSGKSVTLKAICSRGIFEGIRYAIIDPSGEYIPLARRLGGLVIRLSEETDVVINPCAMAPEIVEEVDEHGNIIEVRKVLIKEKISELLNCFNIMISGSGDQEKGLNTFEADILEQAIRKVIERAGITEDPASLYEERQIEKNGVLFLEKQKKPEITISDIYNQIIADNTIEENGQKVLHEHARRLVAGIRPYLRGNSRGIFDGQTNFGRENAGLNFDNSRLIVFDISKLEEGFLKPLAFHVCLTYLWNDFVVRDRSVKKCIAADEAWMLVDYPRTLTFLEKVARTIRKYTGQLIIASQDFQKFALNPTARSVIQNSDSVILLSQNELDRKNIQETYQLSQGEMEVIMTNSDEVKGEGLFRMKGESVWLKVEISPDEMPYFSTTYGEATSQGR